MPKEEADKAKKAKEEAERNREKERQREERKVLQLQLWNGTEQIFWNGQLLDRNGPGLF